LSNNLVRSALIRRDSSLLHSPTSLFLRYFNFRFDVWLFERLREDETTWTKQWLFRERCVSWWGMSHSLRDNLRFQILISLVVPVPHVFLSQQNQLQSMADQRSPNHTK
jgi:hypothetical protein